MNLDLSLVLNPGELELFTARLQESEGAINQQEQAEIEAIRARFAQSRAGLRRVVLAEILGVTPAPYVSQVRVTLDSDLSANLDVEEVASPKQEVAQDSWGMLATKSKPAQGKNKSHHIGRERVRQIEVRALDSLRRTVKIRNMKGAALHG